MRISFKMGAIACALSLNGCSTLQSWFPDKEKDYQFTTELPPLIIPADLIQKPSLPISHRSTVTEPVVTTKKLIESKKSAEKTLTSKAEPPAPIVNRPTLTEPETEVINNKIEIRLTHENVPTLHLNVPSARAWRIVGKAVSRSSGIEIIERNQDNQQIRIHVANEKPVAESETSFLEDSLSVFDGFVNNDTAYVLQFHEVDSTTAITVLNSELQSLEDNSDNKILTILFDTIKADLSK